MSAQERFTPAEITLIRQRLKESNAEVKAVYSKRRLSIRYQIYGHTASWGEARIAAEAARKEALSPHPLPGDHP